MPREFGSVADRVAGLNSRYAHRGAIQVLTDALRDPDTGPRGVWSVPSGPNPSFCLHMVARVDRRTPVLFIDTEMLYPRDAGLPTQEVSAKLGPGRVARSSGPAKRQFLPMTRMAICIPKGHRRLLRVCGKSQPLEHALAPFDAWITGPQDGFRAGTRSALEFFEAEGQSPDQDQPSGPLAARGRGRSTWSENNLPRHPLVAQGYPFHRMCTLHIQSRSGRRRRARGAGATAPRWNAAFIL